MKVLSVERSFWCLLLFTALTAGTLYSARANPVGGQVRQGTASFNNQGPVLTIQASDRTQINWNSFNIGVGETTRFLQPNSSSVVWNFINDANPSQILGNLNANGYVVLQNPSGFFIGGQAVLSTHGLLMTTSRSTPPDLSGSGAWQFNLPPPSASIINYGQIRQPEGDHGGSVFLIAQDIQNNGSIAAPQGSIGLYAGQQVMVSRRPDGRGLSARVTLPQGSVNNQGQLMADAGVIAMNAQVVNQGGLVQANSVRQNNGVIELVASDSLTLGQNSVLSAQGDATAGSASQGGFVVTRAGRAFSDSQGSTINVAGQNQGRNGVVEVLGPGLSLAQIQSQVDGQSATAFSQAGDWFLLNPQNITLSISASTPSAANPNFKLKDLLSFSKIDLFALGNINLKSSWNLGSSLDTDARLMLSAGSSITMDNGSSIIGGNNWNVAMTAGPANLTTPPLTGFGIYLNGNSFIQTLNGNIDLWAANEIIVNPGTPFPRATGAAGNNGIRTRGGGNIDVTAEFGDVNTGGNFNGFLFGQAAAPYYRISTVLGGISTAAGGNVNIIAGRDVTSYLPIQSDFLHAQFDGGSGAFGPGDVNITAGRNVAGHYVLANGRGTISAGGDIGVPSGTGGFALSLISGSWGVSAPNGNIYLQDARNPNGIFDDAIRGSTLGGYHYFDFDPLASLSLSAGNRVEITGIDAPHGVPSAPGSSVPFLFPPSLRIEAGPGGVVLDADVILFPSPNGELHVNTSGDFRGYQDPTDPRIITVSTLSMSDSGSHTWLPNTAAFGFTDHAIKPPELDNPHEVEISVGGNMQNLVLRTTKATDIHVSGNMYNSSFLGQNLHPLDTTLIHVDGTISYPPVYTFASLLAGERISSPEPGFSPAWDAIFSLLVNPTASLRLTPTLLGLSPAQLTSYVYNNIRLSLTGNALDPGYSPAANPGFIYDAASGRLGYAYQMSPAVYSALNSSAIRILKLDPQGHVMIEQHSDGNYYIATTTTSFVDRSILDQLYSPVVAPVQDYQHVPVGFQIGGPGHFNISAGSMDLGSSSGIFSWGIGSSYNPINYASLAPYTHAGASIDVEVEGDINLLTSTIASVFGGNITVSSGGNIYLSQGNFALIPPGAGVSYGIFTSGHSDVSVTAHGDINVGGARIAAFNGGRVFVRSEEGDVNAGNGANSILVVPVIRRDPNTGSLISDSIQNPRPFGSGIMAISPTDVYRAIGANGLPGDIIVETPNGDIISTLGGIQQFALNGSVEGGPSITLTAGTPGGHPGNVDLGQGGVIGGTINITAQGNISGLIVSRQDANINAAQSFSGTLLSGGTANLNAGGAIAGTVIGIGGVNASGGAGVTANVLGQNVSIGGAQAQSTLGTTAAASTAGQAAAQQAASDTKQQLAKESSQDSDDSKKKASLPALVKRVGRVTVLLPSS